LLGGFRPWVVPRWLRLHEGARVIGGFEGKTARITRGAGVYTG